MNNQKKLDCFYRLIKHFKIEQKIVPFLRWHFLLNSSCFHIYNKKYFKVNNSIKDENNKLILTISENRYDFQIYFHEHNLSCGIKIEEDEDGQIEVFYILFENGRWCLYDTITCEYSQSFVWKELTLS